MLSPWILGLALVRGEAVYISPLVIPSCRLDLPRLLGGPHEHCKVAENLETSHGVADATPSATVCVCLGV